MRMRSRGIFLEVTTALMNSIQSNNTVSATAVDYTFHSQLITFLRSIVEPSRVVNENILLHPLAGKENTEIRCFAGRSRFPHNHIHHIHPSFLILKRNTSVLKTLVLATECSLSTRNISLFSYFVKRIFDHLSIFITSDNFAGLLLLKTTSARSRIRTTEKNLSHQQNPAGKSIVCGEFNN